MLSIFVNGYKYFVASKKGNGTVSGSEKVISMIAQLMPQNERTVIFSSGPDTFTSMRVMGSIVKGISLSSPQIDFLSISNFLTLFSLVPNNINSGIIAINTKRGDFYCMDFVDTKLFNYKTLWKKELPSNNEIVMHNEDIDDINLAVVQIDALNGKKFKDNQHLISRSLKVNYGAIPQYKY